jgi:hypothetical protein
MAAATAFQLPGVYFLPTPRAAGFNLPPLDVAGFVGFVTRGPLDMPVPVEDLSHFDAIFGGPLAVARDLNGSPLYGKLRDAVAGFFASGGTRCYVVRVAGPNASSAKFAVPGIVAIDSFGTPARAEIDASSQGNWGSTLRIGTLETMTPMAPLAFAVVDGKTLSWTLTGTPRAVQAGDVLQLTFVDGRQWLFPVASVIPAGVEESQFATLVASSVWRMSSGVGSQPPMIIAVSRMTLTGPSLLSVSASFSVGPSDIVLELDGSDALKVQRDDLLLLEFGDGSEYVLGVSDAQARRGSPSLPQAMVSTTQLICVREAGLATSALPTGAALGRVDLLQMSLRIVWGNTSRYEIDDLGFNGGHPRFWVDVAVAQSTSGDSSNSAPSTTNPTGSTFEPGDATQIYTNLFGPARVDLDWTDGRLPIVASSLLAPAPASGLTYLPVGMPLIGSDADLVGPDDSSVATDDLSTFDARPFLDSYLVNPTQPASSVSLAAASLLAAATDRYFLQDVRLKGIHSLMFVDEVALIAVPDAVNLGWSPGDIVPMSAPPVFNAPPTQTNGFADCGIPPALLSVDPSGGPVSTAGGPPTLVTITGSRFTDSGTVSVSFGALAATNVQVVGPTTLTCLVPQASAPGAVTVTVTTVNGSASLPTGFLYWVPSTEAELPVGTIVDDFDPETLQRIHVCLIGVCQARSDAVAVMALPLHFGTSECIGWLQTLRQNLHLPRHGSVFNDARALADLSYASVYHPWVLVPDPTAAPGTLRSIPPDGVVCGVIAAREIARQVWVAPANVPIAGVLGLQPSFSRDDWAQLCALGFNLVRPEAVDFRVMSAHTLADDASLLQLSVRRLLIQLRKAVLTRGQNFVFEKNDDRFRQRVRHGLESLLANMFDGGAFAGATQQSSYRISVDDSVSTAGDADEGRMVAQILVAPSQPMEFLTVLLSRVGEGSLQAAEA